MKDEDVRYTVMEALGQISNPSDQIIQTIINASNDKDWNVRNTVMKALGQISNPSDQIIQILINASNDKNEENEDVRYTVMESIRTNIKSK